jgi:hypothetical protein
MLAYWPILKRSVLDLTNVLGLYLLYLWYHCEVIIKDNMVLWADMSSGWVVDKCNTSGVKWRVSKIYPNVRSQSQFWWSN